MRSLLIGGGFLALAIWVLLVLKDEEAASRASRRAVRAERSNPSPLSEAHSAESPRAESAEVAEGEDSSRAELSRAVGEIGARVEVFEQAREARGREVRRLEARVTTAKTELIRLEEKIRHYDFRLGLEGGVQPDLTDRERTRLTEERAQAAGGVAVVEARIEEQEAKLRSRSVEHARLVATMGSLREELDQILAAVERRLPTEAVWARITLVRDRLDRLSREVTRTEEDGDGIEAPPGGGGE